MRLRPGLCPGPPLGAYSAPPDPLAGFKWRGGERREGEGEEGRLTLMRSWNRAADWLRPALRVVKGGMPRWM